MGLHIDTHTVSGNVTFRLQSHRDSQVHKILQIKGTIKNNGLKNKRRVYQYFMKLIFKDKTQSIS